MGYQEEVHKAHQIDILVKEAGISWLNTPQWSKPLGSEAKIDGQGLYRVCSQSNDGTSVLAMSN
jgi:hypothetical protein